MNGKIKTLGLALLATFAMSAVAAASASAVDHVFKAAAYPTHLTAEAKGDQVFEATTGEGKGTACESVNVSGTVEKESGEVTVEPNYTKCYFWEGTPKRENEISSAVVKDEGCLYTFTGATNDENTTNFEGPEHETRKEISNEHAEVHLTHKEEQCAHLEVRATAFQFKCISLPTTVENEEKKLVPQTLNGVRYTSTVDPVTEKEDITVEATVHGITSTTTESIANCGEEKHTNGSYTGNVTVRGYSDEAHTEPTDVTIG